jgi:hypothetical protein
MSKVVQTALLFPWAGANLGKACMPHLSPEGLMMNRTCHRKARHRSYTNLRRSQTCNIVYLQYSISKQEQSNQETPKPSEEVSSIYAMSCLRK